MDLSVIILSYNTKEITDKCLNRLQLSVISCQTKLKNKIEVIVLDNTSSDGSVEMIKKNYPWVKLIESKVNTGFSKGNNIAFSKSKNPIILFLNSDVFVEDDSLEKALEYFSNHNCDVLGIKLLYENGNFQPSGGNLPTFLNTTFWILGLGQILTPFHPRDKSFFSKEREVGWVMGAFLLIKKEVFESSGGFDENIFMYMDEVDLCKRIRDKGFKICFTPSVSAIHLQRASSRGKSEKSLSLELKGIKVYFGKYYPNLYWFVKIFLILGLLLRIIAFSLRGKHTRAAAYIEGLKFI